MKRKIFKGQKRKLTGNTTRLTDALDGSGEVDDDDDAVVITEESPSSSPGFETMDHIPAHGSISRRGQDEPEVLIPSDDNENRPEHIDEEEDKKKLDFKISYDGFSIWGWTLVLLVKRKDQGAKNRSSASTADAMMGLKDTSSSSSSKDTGQGLMEEWISTQAAGEATFDDEDEGD